MNGKSNVNAKTLDAITIGDLQATIGDLQALAKALWREVDMHPIDAECECPATEAIRALQELGYTITKAAPAPVKTSLSELIGAVEDTQERQLAHRRSCGYCHTHASTLCPLGKHLLNDYYQATRRLQDITGLGDPEWT